ncbi:KTSC domain-containing protein [Pedobacter metabolipauper]|uniref:KTSC domain-containing protein n=1 Tax=Pedobacter metabolipauper TaxID=425513 RepID=A0A4R6T1S4_9SPHI|nr:KTSC domain-containing protein [Pedobacter metabolipauper]TDQ11450.1 KTSC domain-containing protein [Pedobacter metabolipauper]
MPSTVIAKIAYDPEYKLLSVEFISGKIYYYKEVPPGVYLTLKMARSKGGFLNKYIKGKYEYESTEI